MPQFTGTVARYSYRIGTGVNLPLGSLTNLEDLCGYPPKSNPVEPYPVRTRTLSGRVVGEGAIGHEWTFPEGVPASTVGTLLNFLFGSGGTASSVQVTINTRDAIVGTYVRYTGYVERPVVGEDYNYDRRFAFDFKLRFLGMTKL